MNNEDYSDFSRIDMLNYIAEQDAKDVIEGLGDKADFNALFEDMFNQDDWAEDPQQANDMLENFIPEPEEEGLLEGAWGAIQLVSDYEDDENLDKSDFTDPMEVANMTAYIRGEQVFSEILDKLNLDFDAKLAEKDNAKKFIRTAKDLLK